LKLTVICTLLFAPLAFADQASKSAKIEQLLAAMNVEQQQKEMLGQIQQLVTSQVKSQMPSQADAAKIEDLQKKMFALIGEETSWQKMKPVFVQVYSETYTEPEIDGILAFYKSPAGRAMVDKQPTLTSKMMTSMQAQMGEIMTKIQKLLQP
jgi:uncharacterized protein